MGGIFLSGSETCSGPAYRNSEVTWRWGGFLTEHNVIKVRGSLVVFSERGFHSPSLKSHPRGSSDVRVGWWGGAYLAVST